MARTITVFDEDGEEQEIPATWAICDQCRGEGTIGNPAFDGMSVNQMVDDWGYDDTVEFLDEYTHGSMYDVRCDDEECQSGKILVPDEQACSQEQMNWYINGQQELADMRAIEASERRFCYGY